MQQQQQSTNADALDVNSTARRRDNIEPLPYGMWFPFRKLKKAENDPPRQDSVEFHFTAHDIAQGYLVMRQSGTGRREYALFESVEDFLTRTDYHVLPHAERMYNHMLPEKRRIHFDFDGGDAPEELAQEAWDATLEAILAVFGEQYDAGILAWDVLVCAGDKKPWSRRIYFPRYAWRNSEEAQWFL